VVDGNDADAVYMVAADVIERARRGRPERWSRPRPTGRAATRADPGKYRPAEEVQAWADRDPIPMYHQRLLRLGVPESRLSEITQGVAQRVEEATEFAKAGAPPGEEYLFTDVWADGGHEWRN
jgi:acetoin:2,6-dichlorophenolindophenol oxidoreductase subunit alpha